jgi:hypothetical protein
MRSGVLSLVLILAAVLDLHGQKTQTNKRTSSETQSYVSFCALDGVYAPLRDAPEKTLVTEIGEVQLFTGGLGDPGASFWFSRKDKTLFRFDLKDLSVPFVWVITDTAHDRVALTYSDGGAIGEFYVRIFQIKGDTVTDLSQAVEPAVADFKSRHYCQARGNNVEALKWVKGDLLLLTDVYPTGDCGPDLGHTEGYRVSVSTGQIEEHLTLQQLKRYPGVCLQNDENR